MVAPQGRTEHIRSWDVAERQGGSCNQGGLDQSSVRRLAYLLTDHERSVVVCAGSTSDQRALTADPTAKFIGTTSLDPYSGYKVSHVINTLRDSRLILFLLRQGVKNLVSLLYASDVVQETRFGECDNLPFW